MVGNLEFMKLQQRFAELEADLRAIQLILAKSPKARAKADQRPPPSLLD